MAAFMICYYLFFFLGYHPALSLWAGDDPLYRLLHLIHLHRLFIAAGGKERGLITQIF